MLAPSASLSCRSTSKISSARGFLCQRMVSRYRSVLSDVCDHVRSWLVQRASTPTRSANNAASVLSRMTNRVVCLASQLFASVSRSMARSSSFNYAGDIGGGRVFELPRVVSLSEHHQSASQRSIARIRVHLGNPQTHAASMQQQAAFHSDNDLQTQHASG